MNAGSSRERGLRIVGVVFGALAVIQVARLTMFAVAPAHTGGAVYPFDKFYVQHSCLSAYFEGAKLAQARTRHLYDEKLYAGTIGPFEIDQYLYPPPFLLLPRALLGVTRDFYRYRTIWFVFELAVFLTALIVVARWIGDRHGRNVLILAGTVLAAVPTAMTLQIGNFQIVAFAVSMIAMALIEGKSVAVGAALLSFVAASKLFPGVLVLSRVSAAVARHRVAVVAERRSPDRDCARVWLVPV